MVVTEPLRVLPLREERKYRLSRRALTRLEAFARLTELDEESALQVLIAHGLGTMQRRQPIWLDPLQEPEPEHNRDGDDG